MEKIILCTIVLIAVIVLAKPLFALIIHILGAIVILALIGAATYALVKYLEFRLF